MQELVAVAALLVSGLDSREPATAGYATACLHNLKRQPAVLAGVDASPRRSSFDLGADGGGGC